MSLSISILKGKHEPLLVFGEEYHKECPKRVKFIPLPLYCGATSLYGCHLSLPSSLKPAGRIIRVCMMFRGLVFNESPFTLLTNF